MMWHTALCAIHALVSLCALSVLATVRLIARTVLIHSMGAACASCAPPLFTAVGVTCSCTQGKPSLCHRTKPRDLMMKPRRRPRPAAGSNDRPVSISSVQVSLSAACPVLHWQLLVKHGSIQFSAPGPRLLAPRFTTSSTVRAPGCSGLRRRGQASGYSSCAARPFQLKQEDMALDQHD